MEWMNNVIGNRYTKHGRNSENEYHHKEEHSPNSRPWHMRDCFWISNECKRKSWMNWMKWGKRWVIHVMEPHLLSLFLNCVPWIQELRRLRLLQSHGIDSIDDWMMWPPMTDIVQSAIITSTASLMEKTLYPVHSMCIPWNTCDFSYCKMTWPTFLLVPLRARNKSEWVLPSMTK